MVLLIIKHNDTQIIEFFNDIGPRRTGPITRMYFPSIVVSALTSTASRSGPMALIKSHW